MMTRSILACSIAILIASAGTSQAGDARAGQAFAIENCGRCHSVGGTGRSANPKSPPFRTIARKYKLEDLEEGFAEGIVTGHNTMPEFTLSPREIEDLLAYMRRLKAR